MPTSFFQYEMLPTTWFYVSALIILAAFFKFNRIWSVRNFDLVGMILFTPGLLMLAMHDDQWGYAWLFFMGILASIRLLFDTVMVRRPLLEPNLTPGGLSFACFFLVAFVIAALVVNRGEQIDTVRTVRLEQILTTRHLEKKVGMDPVTLTFPAEELPKLPPGFRPFHALAERMDLALAPPKAIRDRILLVSVDVPKEPKKSENPDLSGSTVSLLTGDFEIGPHSMIQTLDGDATDRENVPPSPKMLSEDEPAISETSASQEFPPAPLGLFVFMMGMAIVSHLMIALAFIHIGHCHFGNIRTGIACAALYFLLPYTNQMIGRLDHLVPGALILWAVAMYRRPFFSGLWIGIAAALVCYPIFLVPLWWSFYWRRGWIRFLVGVVSAGVIFILLLLFSPASLGSYGDQLMHLFGKSSLWIFTQSDGFWNYYDMIYRVPILAMFGALTFGMILWPAHKHLATLLSCSSLLMLCVQFWQLHQGGLFMAWYLPLMILAVFRPNLEDRMAQSMVVS